jgi:nitrous oxide reductase accessory protein NosL
MCEHERGCPHKPETETRTRVSRRQVLAGGVALAAGLAGCQGSNGTDGETPEPISLTQSDQCEVCGMVIPNHPGPTTEIFYRDQQPSGHENPARFDSTWEAFQYDFERQNQGWEWSAFYVTDYSAVDYELFTDAGDTLISTHVAAADFVDATTVTFVVGSEVKGAMGRDLIAFSEEADAEQFQSDYGGDRRGFDEITKQTIAGLGRE